MLDAFKLNKFALTIFSYNLYFQEESCYSHELLGGQYDYEPWTFPGYSFTLFILFNLSGSVMQSEMTLA